MRTEFEELAKAKTAVEKGRMTEAAEHVVRDCDVMIRMLFHVPADALEPSTFERRYKKTICRIPEAYRPSPELLQRMLALRGIPAHNERQLTGEEIRELISGMDTIIKLFDDQAKQSPYD